MLVIVEYGDIHDFFQFIFDIIAFGGRNIFQIDCRKGSFQGFYDSNKFIRILLVNADRNRIHSAEPFEQDSLAFHNRHGCCRANIAQTQHPGAVSTNAGHVAAASVLKSHFRMFLDLFAGLCNARRIGYRQIMPVIQGRFATDLHFSVIIQMHFQRLLL